LRIANDTKLWHKEKQKVNKFILIYYAGKEEKSGRGDVGRRRLVGYRLYAEKTGL
jgi:hypothetical protein